MFPDIIHQINQAAKMYVAANKSGREYYNASQTISTGKWLIILLHTTLR